MIPKDSIDTAYSFFHQKYRVYAHSRMEWQRDDIEIAVAGYADLMNPELFGLLSGGDEGFLHDHTRFGTDLANALGQLESMIS